MFPPPKVILFLGGQRGGTPPPLKFFFDVSPLGGKKKNYVWDEKHLFSSKDYPFANIIDPET